MSSLLIGEGANRDDADRITAALRGTEGVGQIIHMKTLYLGPDELLVAAKLGFGPTDRADDIAATIDRAESAVREAVPVARVIYLEPDIYRADYVPAERPAAPDSSGGH